MANNVAFYPQSALSATVTQAVTTSSAPYALPSNASAGGQGWCQYYIANIGTNWVYFTFGASSSVSTSVAGGVPIPPNSAQTFSGPPNGYIAVIAGSTGNTIQIVGGEGM